MTTATNTAQISAAGREAAAQADSVARARVDQNMTERIGAQLGRTDVTARVAQACGRIIIMWSGQSVKWQSAEESAEIHQAETEREALARALAAAGYGVSGSETTRTFTGWTEVHHGAAVAVAIKPQN